MKEIQSNLKQIVEEYNKNKKKAIIFNFKDAYKRSVMNDSNKQGNGINLHYIHYYPGRIYPYIYRYLLSLPEFQHLDGCLLDPFAGSGTILLGSITNPIIKRNSFGVEINPVGRLISKVKTTYIDLSQIDKLMKDLHKLYSQRVSIDELIPQYKNINLWFSYQAIKKLCKLKYAIESIDTTENFKDFFWVCFSSIVRKVSLADPYIPPPVLLKLDKYKDTPKYAHLEEHLLRAKRPNLWKIFEETVMNNTTKLWKVHKFIKNYNDIKSEIIWNDAKKIKKGKLEERGRLAEGSAEILPSGAIDIIFTSPPYLTAQKYIRTSKLELLWLGYSAEYIGDIEKKSIGTERVSSNTEIEELDIATVDTLIDAVLSKSKERGVTVYNYFKNMLEAIKEMHRVLKKGGYLILVVGDNRVLGKKIGTYKLLTEIAITKGFTENVTLKDEITNRSMMTKRNGSGGLIKDEYVILLKKEG